ncbi:cation efflux family-domain-containing protein [Chytriomyces sp. MP71]|nr:cation efflux family-domain-containing protein [Chytriomyces sp. MP71]
MGGYVTCVLLACASLFTLCDATPQWRFSLANSDANGSYLLAATGTAVASAGPQPGQPGQASGQAGRGTGDIEMSGPSLAVLGAGVLVLAIALVLLAAVLVLCLRSSSVQRRRRREMQEPETVPLGLGDDSSAYSSESRDQRRRDAFKAQLHMRLLDMQHRRDKSLHSELKCAQGASVVFALFVAQFILANMYGSLALTVDAYQSATLSFVGVLAWLKKRAPNPQLTYGHARMEVLVIMVAIRGVFSLRGKVSLFLTRYQIHKLKQVMGNPISILITGCVGLLVNVLGIIWFRPKKVPTHLRGYETIPFFRPEATQNKQKIFMAGVQGSLGVIIASAVVQFAPAPFKLYIDAVNAIAFSLLMVARTVPQLRASAHILLQGVPTRIPVRLLEDEILAIPGVLKVTKLNVWSLTGMDTVASAHLHIDAVVGMDAVKRVTRVLDGFGVRDVTVQPVFVVAGVGPESDEGGASHVVRVMTPLERDVEGIQGERRGQEYERNDLKGKGKV